MATYNRAGTCYKRSVGHALSIWFGTFVDKSLYGHLQFLELQECRGLVINLLSACPTSLGQLLEEGHIGCHWGNGFSRRGHCHGTGMWS